MVEKEPDSTLSHSDCQMVIEKEAESLKQIRSRWADTCLSHNDTAEANLFPMEPHNPKRGKISGHNNPEVNSFTLQQKTLDFANVVNQGYQGENFIPCFTYKKKQQQPQRQQQQKPWQKKSWKKWNEEEER